MSTREGAFSGRLVEGVGLHNRVEESCEQQQYPCTRSGTSGHETTGLHVVKAHEVSCLMRGVGGKG